MAKLSQLYKSDGSSRNKWHKKNPEKAKELSKKYYQNLSEEKKKEIREKIREYNRDLRKLDLELGNCINCHKPKEDPRYKQCIDCRAKARKRDKLKREIKKQPTPKELSGS